MGAPGPARAPRAPQARPLLVAIPAVWVEGGAHLPLPHAPASPHFSALPLPALPPKNPAPAVTSDPGARAQHARASSTWARGFLERPQECSEELSALGWGAQSPPLKSRPSSLRCSQASVQSAQKGRGRPPCLGAREPGLRRAGHLPPAPHLPGAPQRQGPFKG